MATRALTTAEKFLFGYPLLSAIRKVAAIAVTLACLFYAFGVLKVAVFGAFGALCLSMMDLPGSPRQVIYAFGMGAALAFTSAAIIALTAAHPIWVTAAFTGLTWFFSTLVVYGKRGAVTSIGCLVLSLIAMYAVGQGMSVAELLLAMLLAWSSTW